MKLFLSHLNEIKKSSCSNSLKFEKFSLSDKCTHFNALECTCKYATARNMKFSLRIRTGVSQLLLLLPLLQPHFKSNSNLVRPTVLAVASALFGL